MNLHLIPAPQKIRAHPGRFELPAHLYVVLPPAADDFSAAHFIARARQLTRSHWHLVRGPSVNPQSEIRVLLKPDFASHLADTLRPQAYALAISPNGITLTASANPGIFYAFQTLLQILRESAYATCDIRILKSAAKSSSTSPKSNSPNPRLFLPCLSLSDHPDFPRRGVYHDTARGKVPTLATLLQLIDDLAHLKYNEFQLYIENNFQFRKHPDMYDDTNPFTAAELLQLDAACRQRHIDFVPSLTSLGHFEKILNRPRYRPLAEAEPAQLKKIGATCWHDAAPWSLCVTDPKARQLLTDMYAEFAPNFTSPQFNICCDEAYDLGKVRSKKRAAKIGTGQMYVDWINFCDRLVKAHGNRSIQMWGDIILNHPELIAQLPPDATLLEWGYEHNHKFDEHCKLFAQRLKEHARLKTQDSRQTRSFYVAPGTSSWLTLSARTKNACGNIHNAATAGLRHGARGILVTDWGDHGHQQFLAVSLLPFAYGAAAGWNLKATPNPFATSQQKAQAPRGSAKHQTRNLTLETLLAAMSLHLFEDPSRQYASLAYDLGLTYERLGWQRFNASLDHFLFREKWDFANYVNRAPAISLEETLHATHDLLAQFQSATLLHPDADQIRAEFILTCDLIAHVCLRTQLRQHWLAADPARRNPEEPELRVKPPVPLPSGFGRTMAALGRNARELRARFADLWLARNQPSRLVDVTAEFDRLAAEYQKFAH